ncbi:hypothetical protein [Thalassotalea fusca]
MSIRRAYFIVAGIFAHVALLCSIVLVAKFFDLTPQQFIYRLAEKTGLAQGILSDTLVNEAFIEQNFPAPLRPQFIGNSPRILKQTAFLHRNSPQVDLTTQQYKSYDPCRHNGPMWDTACFLISKRPDLADVIKQRMLLFDIVAPNASGHHGNGWQLAFIYDSVKGLITLTDGDRKAIEEKLLQAVTHYLLLLNDDSPSLWHGRTTLTAQMWLSYIALDAPPEKLAEQVSAHFYGMVEALEITEGWPEGYNYWINARAFYVALALSSYLQGTESNIWHARIKDVMKRIGRWHVYATRPDNIVEGIGDEGPRIDLKDETRRVIDILHQSIDDPVLSQFSERLEAIHGRESYYRGYRWGWSLFNSQVMYGNSSALVNKHYPQPPTMDIFGKSYFGQAYIHQHWQPDKTFITFRAGDSFTHHGHYDNGHISLFKATPLLVNSSQYQGFNQENRLNYSIRSVAKNTILIKRPSDKYDDGGQRVTQPLGSAILSPKHWYEQRVAGANLAGGKMEASYHDDNISFISSDLTTAYDSTWYDSQGKGGKVSLVKRSLLYIYDADLLFIRDQIKTTRADYPVSLLFHSVNRPSAALEEVIEGDKNNGISATSTQWVQIENGQGKLTLEFVEQAQRVFMIGGNDYQFYVKSSHLDRGSAGKNMVEGLTSKAKQQAPNWRLEVELVPEGTNHSMVTVARPSIGDYRYERTEKVQLTNGNTAYITEDIAVLFSRDQTALTQLPMNVKQVFMCEDSEKEQEQTCSTSLRTIDGGWHVK